MPGRLGHSPLHRLAPRYDINSNIPGSRRKVRRTCRHYFGAKYTSGPNNTKRECDEYPFATTYQNAAKVNEHALDSFAVRAITASHNGTAGNLYGTWLGSDHILDGDPFYVVVR
ncbi:NucA/NucB deoxyribonuclease domain-containing protein [Kibdelosporangium persicum]|uniref:NucA/NucB deoxyribonuclease domain-containing protein n=1 Tax=Kibdelosporangium persicum TaxID=2698649 RepID=UPI0015633C08